MNKPKTGIQDLAVKIYRKLRKPLRNYIYSNSKKRINYPGFHYKTGEVMSELNSLNDIYNYFHQFYWHAVPDWLKRHRDYFSENRRGFGEDAFHAAWYLFLIENRPQNLLEIGIYRGQVISLWSLIGTMENMDLNITGISPFTDAGDEYTTYSNQIDYYADVLTNFREFNLPVPELHRGYSTEPGMKEIIASRQWDLVYIDGCHDYEVVSEDFSNCDVNLKNNGFIVMDDASLYLEYKPPMYAFAGHPGPSRVADRIESYGYKEVLTVGHNRFFQKRR
jgi:hypothetical protein